jgi:hypothetical protein
MSGNVAPSCTPLSGVCHSALWTTPVGNGCGSLSQKLVIPGGRDPDWGPADPAGGGGPPGTDPPPPPGGGAKQAATVSVASAVRRRALVRRGLAVRASCPVTCRVDAVAKARGRRAGAAKAKGSGTVNAVIRVSRRAAKARKLAVTVTVRADGAQPLKVKRTVRVR